MCFCCLSAPGPWPPVRGTVSQQLKPTPAEMSTREGRRRGWAEKEAGTRCEPRRASATPGGSPEPALELRLAHHGAGLPCLVGRPHQVALTADVGP